jgi:hypothetical protein
MTVSSVIAATQPRVDDRPRDGEPGAPVTAPDQITAPEMSGAVATTAAPPVLAPSPVGAVEASVDAAVDAVAGRRELRVERLSARRDRRRWAVFSLLCIVGVLLATIAVLGMVR